MSIDVSSEKALLAITPQEYESSQGKGLVQERLPTISSILTTVIIELNFPIMNTA